jgi:transcriptional regulator with XRE-family HTH domain
MARETDEQREKRLKQGGAWLLAELQKRDWSQRYLADELGVAQQQVSAYVNGRYEIDGELARDVARLFNMSEYDTWRGLRRQLPAEVASRRRLITYAFSLMNDKDAEDLYEQVIAYVRARRGGAKAGGAQVKTPRVTRPGGSPSSGSQGEESAV